MKQSVCGTFLLNCEESNFPAVSAAPEEAAPPTLAEMEKRHIAYMMERCGNNKSMVSRKLGISRNTLKDKLRKYGFAIPVPAV